MLPWVQAWVRFPCLGFCEVEDLEASRPAPAARRERRRQRNPRRSQSSLCDLQRSKTCKFVLDRARDSGLFAPAVGPQHRPVVGCVARHALAHRDPRWPALLPACAGSSGLGALAMRRWRTLAERRRYRASLRAGGRRNRRPCRRLTRRPLSRTRALGRPRVLVVTAGGRRPHRCVVRTPCLAAHEVCRRLPLGRGVSPSTTRVYRTRLRLASHPDERPKGESSTSCRGHHFR